MKGKLRQLIWDENHQHSCLRCLNPWSPCMEPPRNPEPKKLIGGIHQGQGLPWMDPLDLVGLKLRLEVTLNGSLKEIRTQKYQFKVFTGAGGFLVGMPWTLCARNFRLRLLWILECKATILTVEVLSFVLKHQVDGPQIVPLSLVRRTL